jgi:hypothetical protein
MEATVLEGECEERKPISLDVIKALSYQLLKEERINVKETIASTIGAIGKPDA